MTAVIMDGVAVSKEVRGRLAARVAALVTKGLRPGLAVMLVGDNPASRVYVRNKVKACADTGIHSVMDEYAADTPAADVLARVRALNADPSIHGILVQLPLPPHIDVDDVLAAIAPEKDVDGFHVESLGALMAGKPGFEPCTPHGVMEILDHYKVPLAGRNAVVIGRSNIVGKPMALMLLGRDATVTICTSKTRDLAAHTRAADIVVVAVGRPRLLTGDMVKPGAVVVDVGINRDADGKLVGDVDYDSVKEVAGFVTPVPGGVGPMTITMLLANAVTAAERVAAGG